MLSRISAVLNNFLFPYRNSSLSDLLVKVILYFNNLFCYYVRLYLPFGLQENFESVTFRAAIIQLFRRTFGDPMQNIFCSIEIFILF